MKFPYKMKILCIFYQISKFNNFLINRNQKKLKVLFITNLILVNKNIISDSFNTQY